ncbi:MAG TPA: sulfotransferase [Planctomycetota bacterium]|nr:sulfotransferase [Planctomycetota bacterium]
MSRPPFFVLGAPRSGTSLLGDLLDTHGNLRVTQELNLTGILRGVQELTAHRARTERVGREEILTRDGKTDAAAYVRQLIASELAESGKQRYGDKHTVYCFEIPKLEALFPGAQYVHIIRDGRDVAYSALDNLSWSRHWRFADWTPKSYAQAASWWSDHVRAARNGGARLGPERYLEVRYEDLMASPRDTMARIFEFLGEALDETSLLALERVKGSLRSWTATMSRREVREFESCGLARSSLTELGYEFADYPPSVVHEYADELAGNVAELVNRGELEQAVELLQGAEARGIDHPLLWNDLGAIAHANQDFGQAARLFVRALRYPDPPLSAAINLLALPMRDESVFALVQAFSLSDPQLDEALEAWLLARGLLPTTAHAVVLARNSVQRALARNATQLETGASVAAWRAMESGRRPEARARFDELSRAGSGLGRLGLALIDLAEGKHGRGKQSLRALLASETTEIDVHEELFARLGGQEVLEEVLPHALAFAHQSPRLRERIAAWLANRGLDADAAETLVQLFAQGRLPRETASVSGGQCSAAPRT